MRRICLLILLITTVLITGCQSASVPTAITSNDIIGQIRLEFPQPWNSVAGTGNVDGRLGVTLVRGESTPGKDLSAYPVLRIDYNNRMTTVLALNTPLEEYGLRVAEEIVPGVTFQPSQVMQMAARPAVQLEGTGDDGRGYVLTILDYTAENAVVTMLLSQPGSVSDGDQAILSEIAGSISVNINPPVTPTIPPEATAEIPVEISPESTIEATSAPESTVELIPTEETAATEVAAVVVTEEAVGRSADQAADSTEAAAPVSTAETLDSTEEASPSTPDVRSAATAEIAPTAESSDTESPTETAVTVDADATPLPEATVEPTPDVAQTEIAESTLIAARTVRLARNLSVVAPEGWMTTSNNHSYAVLHYGEEIADAILRENPIPAGQAMIVIDVGTAAEMFPPGSPVDLPGRLRFRVENLTRYVDPVIFGEIRTTAIHNKKGVETLVTSASDDQYVILVEIGGNVFIQIKLLTASGEISDFSPIAYEVAQSIVPR